MNKVFDRVNRNARNLKPQELRHARFSGWFITSAEEEAEHDFWESLKITTKARSKRMDNVQFISELMLVIIERKIVGFNQDYLDDRTAFFEDVEEDTTEIDVDLFDTTMTALKSYISKMEQHNGSITRYAKTQATFYSLWAVLCLNQKLIPEKEAEFAEKYATFMDRVKKIRDNEVSTDEVRDCQHEQIFAENLRGARSISKPNAPTHRPVTRPAPPLSDLYLNASVNSLEKSEK